MKQHKPSPEGILLALSILQCSLDDALYIGDSVVDAESAHAAGIGFIGVLNGTTTYEELASYPNEAIIDNLNGLIG